MAGKINGGDERSRSLRWTVGTTADAGSVKVWLWECMAEWTVWRRKGKDTGSPGYGVAIYMDAKIRKNHNRSSEEESHKVLTTGGGLTRKETGNLSKGVNKEQGHLPYLQVLKYAHQ